MKFAHAEDLHLIHLRVEGSGFELAGADCRFHPVTVAFEGNTVVLTVAAVSEPVAARHAWTNAPAVLRHAAGLPAALFRHRLVAGGGLSRPGHRVESPVDGPNSPARHLSQPAATRPAIPHNRQNLAPPSLLTRREPRPTQERA